MGVSFAEILVGQTYSRNGLAPLWGYESFHALARGVVTRAEDNKFILFMTQQKERHSEQYADKLEENRLYWMGPSDHFAEDRILSACTTGDEIHLFYRERHRQDYTYMGRVNVVGCEQLTDRPSQFLFKVRQDETGMKTHFRLR
jgi:hypothetical protein